MRRCARVFCSDADFRERLQKIAAETVRKNSGATEKDQRRTVTTFCRKRGMRDRLTGRLKLRKAFRRPIHWLQANRSWVMNQVAAGSALLRLRIGVAVLAKVQTSLGRLNSCEFSYPNIKR